MTIANRFGAVSAHARWLTPLLAWLCTGAALAQAPEPVDLRPALSGDNASLFYHLGPIANAGRHVGSDSLLLTLRDPRQPGPPRRFTVRSTLRLRSAQAGGTVFPGMYNTLLWVSQGQIYRMPMQQGLTAPATRVSGLQQVCDIVPTDPGQREDAPVLAVMADRRGQCPQGDDVASLRLVRPDAGPTDMGRLLGHAPDLKVLGMLHAADGGPGPLLVHQARTGRVDVVDTRTQDARQPDQLRPLELLIATSNLPLKFSLLPDVHWQVAVLEANGQTHLLDWRSGTPRLQPLPLPPHTQAEPWMVSGAWADSFLLHDSDQLLSVSTQGAVERLAHLPAPTEGEQAGWPTGLELHNQGCTLAIHMALQPGSKRPVALTQLTLHPLLHTVQPLDLQTRVNLQVPPRAALLLWRPTQPDDTLQTLTRVNCDTAQTDVLVLSAVPMASFPWYGPMGRQRIWPLLAPPSTGDLPSIRLPKGSQRVLTGSELRTYNATRDTWLHHGTLPQLGDAHITDLTATPVQVSTHLWQFEALAVKPNGQRVLAMLVVSAVRDGPVQVMLPPEPWPAP